MKTKTPVCSKRRYRSFAVVVQLFHPQMKARKIHYLQTVIKSESGFLIQTRRQRIFV
jgi:hypothetical protein